MMSHNHELENQDLHPATTEDESVRKELSQQDLNAISGGSGEIWNLHVDDMTIGGENWTNQHGPVTPADYGEGQNATEQTGGPIVTDTSPPPPPA